MQGNAIHYQQQHDPAVLHRHVARERTKRMSMWVYVGVKFFRHTSLQDLTLTTYVYINFGPFTPIRPVTVSPNCFKNTVQECS